MTGITVDGPTYIFDDNKSVICNTTNTDYTPKKKLKSIAYLLVMEGPKRYDRRTAYGNTHKNPAYLLMKVIPMSEKRQGFVQMIKHHTVGSLSEANIVA